MQLFIRVLCSILLFSCAIEANIEPEKAEEFRKVLTQEHLSNHLATTIPKNFWIDACCSGGGYRAMIATAGFVSGLTETGFYNGICSMACLSGSTWMVGPFMAKKMPINLFSSKLKELVTEHDFYDNTIPTLKAIAQNLEQRFNQNRFVQVIDIYGGFIADRLMGDLGTKWQDCTVSDFAQESYLSEYPLPIFTTIHPHRTTEAGCFKCTVTTDYRWIEINPFMTHQTFSTAAHIPTRSLGLLPTNKLQPLMPLSSLLGFCGSAFSATPSDLARYIKEKNIKTQLNQKIIEHLVQEGQTRANKYPNRGIILRDLITSLKEGRLFPGSVPNFTNCDDDRLVLVDAGMSMNLPFPPLFERNSPVIIVCDADGGAGTNYGEHPALNKAAGYAQERRLPFPSLKHPIIKSKTMIVFKEKDPNTPTILYFFNPIKKSSFDFNYSADEFDEIFTLMRSAIIDNVDYIREEILEKIHKLDS